MYGQPADRQYYLYQTRDLGGELAAKTLLLRFSCTCENSKVDSDEKQITQDLLVSIGEPAIEPVKQFLRFNDKYFNWPYRTLSQLIPEEELNKFLIELLDTIGPEYVRNPERKEQLMHICEGLKNEDIAKSLLPYLDDNNETIQFLAADAAIAHGYPFDITALSERLGKEDSQRILVHILKAFKENGWKIEQEHIEKAHSNVELPSEYHIKQDGSVQ